MTAPQGEAREVCAAEPVAARAVGPAAGGGLAGLVTAALAISNSYSCTVS